MARTVSTWERESVTMESAGTIASHAEALVAYRLRGKEEAILLLCSRVDMSGEEAAMLGDLARGQVDWREIVASAAVHRVLPLLHANLKKHLPEAIPHDLSAEIRERVLHNGMSNLALLGILIDVVALLRQNGIEVLSFKGPVLAEEVYGNIGLRAFSDLDLLVARHDLPRVVTLLLGHGFRLEIDLSEEQYQKLAERNHHAVMIRDGVPVELHWELSGRYFSRGVYFEALSGRAERLTLSGQQLLTLGGEDLLIYLCVHGCRHHWEQLDAVCCVAEFVKRRTVLDWDLLWRLAGEMGATHMVALGLSLAESMLAVQLPREARERVASFPRLGKLAEEVAERMLAQRTSQTPAMGYWQFVAFHRRVMERRWDWLLYCSKPLWNPTHSDWLSLRLPASLSALYYLLRPLRLLRKYGRKAWGRISSAGNG